MTAAFADTFYFIALFNPQDAAHDAAVAISDSMRRPIVTTDCILTELGDGLADSPMRRIFAKFVERLRSEPRTLIAPISSDTFNRAIQLYDQRPDKEWSLTDCISFIVMQDQGLTDALTGDHHFELAGFKILFP